LYFKDCDIFQMNLFLARHWVIPVKVGIHRFIFGNSLLPEYPLDKNSQP